MWQAQEEKITCNLVARLQGQGGWAFLSSRLPGRPLRAASDVELLGMFGILEGALVLAGLTGGWAIGRRARQAVHDDTFARAAGGHSTIRSGGGLGNRVLTPSADHDVDVPVLSDTTITAMLVGSASVGKTMFCMRTTNPETRVQMRMVRGKPQTLKPATATYIPPRTLKRTSPVRAPSS